MATYDPDRKKYDPNFDHFGFESLNELVKCSCGEMIRQHMDPGTLAEHLRLFHDADLFQCSCGQLLSAHRRSIEEENDHNRRYHGERDARLDAEPESQEDQALADAFEQEGVCPECGEPYGIRKDVVTGIKSIEACGHVLEDTSSHHYQPSSPPRPRAPRPARPARS